MRAGRMRFRVQIQQNASTQDAAGQIVPAWTTLATVWADCRTMRGREFRESGAIQAEESVEFLCRWPFNEWTARAQLRIVFKDATYEVISVANKDERNRELMFVCRKGVNNG